MQKKIVVIALAAALAVPALVLGQAKADLSGTWTFDEAKSDPAPGPGGGGVGRGGGRMGGGTPTKLVIKQTGAELTVERTLPNGALTAAVYKLDGSESVNKMGMGEATSKASWDGANFVITGKQAISTPQGDFEIDTKDVYSVSDSTLTLTTTRTTPRGEITRKLVFNKG